MAEGKGWIRELLESLFGMITRDVKGFVILALIAFGWYQMNENNKLRKEMVELQPQIYERIIQAIQPQMRTIQKTVNEAKANVDTMRENLAPITEKIEK